MKPTDLDQELRKAGQELLPEVPDIIRRRQDEVYASLADLPLQAGTDRSPRAKKLRRAVGAAVAAVVLGVTSSAYISPVMAESLKGIPLIGSFFKFGSDLGLRTADERGMVDEPNASATQEGVTIRIPQIVYDGIRLSMAVTREGGNFAGGITDYKVEKDGNDTIFVYEKGAISSIEMFVDGTPIHDYDGSKRPHLIGDSLSSDPDMAFYKLVNFSQMGEGALTLPDQFLLTAKITIEGIKEPFLIDVPVRKTADRVDIAAKEAREWNGLKLTLDKLTYTPITTGLTVNIERKSKENAEDQTDLSFDIADDQGRVVEWLSGKGVYDDKHTLKVEMLFDRFDEAPSTITIKPFLPVFQDPAADTGRYALDSNGELIKKYIKELEITVPLDREKLEKLYTSHSVTHHSEGENRK